ncbi:hypothetical protein C818_02537 [Lachnospiraceae bacterium MD308]|nr:hypothetical protein C818_02537 [Lachnospiraceae bacterium MD308]MCI8504144.1 hypothetical protein [Dorea sp.]
MWQKSENENQENLSIEEYLVRRKNISEERKNSDKHGLTLPESRKWIFAGLYM